MKNVILILIMAAVLVSGYIAVLLYVRFLDKNRRGIYEHKGPIERWFRLMKKRVFS